MQTLDVSTHNARRMHGVVHFGEAEEDVQGCDCFDWEGHN